MIERDLKDPALLLCLGGVLLRWGTGSSCDSCGIGIR